MLGDLGKEIIIEQAIRKPLQMRPMVSFYGHPLPENPTLGIDSEFFLTNGLYYVRYAPSPAKKFAKDDFFIACDFLPNSKARLANYREFNLLASHDLKFAWIKKYTNISAELFAIARSNINMPIPFAFDMNKYHNDTGIYFFRPDSVRRLEQRHYTVGHFDPRYRAALHYGANRPWEE